MYWLRRYVFIKDADTDTLILFNPNAAQRIMLDLWGMLEEMGLAVAVICLKARQHGISTLTEMAVAHRIQFKRDVNAIVGSSDPTKSEMMSKMMEMCWANQPWWMMPSRTVDRRGSLIEFGGMNSGVSIQHGSQFTGIGRGTTPSTVHLCVSPQTLIRTADSRVIPITELGRGNLVLTATGALAKVCDVWKSLRRNELTSDIWLWGSFAPLSCTRDHLVLSEGVYKEAHTLGNGDFVSYPIRPITHDRKDVIMYRRRLGAPSKRSGHKTSTTPVVVKLDRDFGWLLGLYLAEGSLGRDGRKAGRETKACSVVFSIHQNEVERFKPRLEKSLSGISTVTTRRTTSKTVNLVTSFTTLARWIEEEFGRADSKHIPDWVWSAGEEFCKGLVEGYIDGDGHIKPNSNELYVTSIRLGLLLGLRELVAALGGGWSGIYFKKAGLYWGRNCQDAWIWCSAGDGAASLRKLLGWDYVKAAPSLHYKYSKDRKFIEIAVERAADGFSEEFWDVEVDDPSHSFVTLQCAVHNSEVASFENPEELIDASLMGAFHESPDRFIVLESTAEGNSGYWFDTWNVAVNSWPKTLFYPVFIPWFVATNLYPAAAELKRNPVPADWEPATLTLTHKQKAELYVASRPELRKHLGKDWTLSKEKMWWWECTREAYKAKKELNLFLQEFTSDPDESFQSTNISAFDADLIAELRDETKSKPPAAVYSITGATVSDRLVADVRDADNSQSPIQVRAHWDTSIPPLDYELFPLKFRSYAEDPMDRLYVWEPPKANIKYVLGVDTSDGVGQDRSIVQVLRLKNPFDPNDFDEQVAEFASPYVNSRDLWPIVLAIATWYSTPQNGKLEQNRVVIECNGNGETVQHEIRKLGWWNFHPWEHYDNKRRAQSNKIGWFTNVRTRSMAVDALVSSIRDGWLKIRSPWFVQEMQAFERDEGRQALRAAYGSHDDRLMSCAFALCSSYIHEITTDGRTFYSHQRKRMTAKGEKQLQGLTQAQLTAQWLKEQGVGKKPYAGNYDPY